MAEDEKTLKEKLAGGPEPDSDLDNDQHIKNMLDREKRKFNENDIMGNFDYNDKGEFIEM